MAKEKSPKAKVKVLSSVTQEMSRQGQSGERFVSSGLEGAYSGFRIRRWEVYQMHTIRLSMQRMRIRSLEDLVVTDKNHLQLAQHLTTCLVEEHSNRLARPGSRGRMLVVRELSRESLASAVKTACELAGVFDA